jgi:predicted Zn-dependent protease
MAVPSAPVVPEHKNMRKIVLVVAALLCLPGFAIAKTAKLTPSDTVASLDFPDSWKVTNIKRGVQAKSPDEEVYVWAELVPSDEVDTVQKEHDDYFEKQKVTMAKSDPVAKEVDGRRWAFIEPQATWKGKPTVVRYIIIDPKVASGKIVVFTYWASPEGDKNYDKEMDGLINSLKASLAQNGA